MADMDTFGASPHDVRIARLRLRAPQGALAALAAPGPSSPGPGEARALAQAWGQAAWPIVDDDEVLLLRRVSVRLAQRDGTPLADQALALEAAAASRALAARAADPWAPGAAQADALRFASRADYVAWRLLAVLGLACSGSTAAGAANTAQRSGRVAALLTEAAPALPAVWRRLREAGGAVALQRLWQALDAPAADALLATVAATHGWLPALQAAPLPATRRPAVSDAPRETHGPERPGTGPTLHRADPGDLLPHATTLWATIGRPGQPAHDPRTRLAALLAWWLHAPARLQAAEAAQALHIAAQRLAATPAHVREAVPPSTPAAATPPAVAVTPLPAGPQPSRRAPPEAAAATPDLTPGVTPPDTLGPTAPRLITHGNLFWLLPVLALAPLQHRLARLDEAQAGWREWVRLVLALGAEPDAAWWAFAADRALPGLPENDAVAALRASPWPPALAAALLEPARQRFGAAALQAALRPCPARVEATEVRVDVHFRLADAQLDVRRAGLDADPGWQPWLGCVLRWHFGSALAPIGDLPR